VSGGVCGDGLAMALHGVAAYVIGEIPRRDDAGQERQAGDDGRGQRAAALTAAYHAGIAAAAGSGTLAFGWMRREAGGPVRVVLAGDALAGGPAGRHGEVLLALPAGACGTVLPGAALAGLNQGCRPLAGDFRNQ